LWRRACGSSEGLATSTTRSGHKGAKPSRSASLNACLRSSRTTLASGLRTEPTPSEKPCGYGEQEARGAVEQLQRQAALLDR